MISIDLSNKNAIVCGASKGIGKAIALSLAECGASVVLLARDGNLLQNCKDQLSTVNNQKHQILMVDFDDPEDLKIKATNLLKDLKPLAVHFNINDGKAAHQTVPHVHLHILPRYRYDSLAFVGSLFAKPLLMLKGGASRELLNEQAQEIKKYL